MIFKNPLFLFLLIPVFLLWLPSSSEILYPSLEFLKRRSPTIRQYFSWLTPLFLTLGFLLLVLAMARPAWGYEDRKEAFQGIAIQMVVDHSGSMGIKVDPQEDLRRLDIVKKAFADFIQQRPYDQIGLITFAKYAETLCPLTNSLDILQGFIQNIEVVSDKSRDGTSLGDALLLASSRLQEQSLNSKVIILLTDGKSNSGQYTPAEALDIIKDWGIKVYTIGFGPQGYVIQESLLGQRRVPVSSTVDDQILKEIAEATGGRFLQAGNPQELQEAVAQINRMEKNTIQVDNPPQPVDRYKFFLLWGALFLVLAIVIDTLIIRRLDL